MQENEWEYIFNVVADCVLTPPYCNTGIFNVAADCVLTPPYCNTGTCNENISLMLQWIVC